MAIRGFLLILTLLAAVASARSSDSEKAWTGVTGRSLDESQPDFQGPPKPPAGAPDIVLIVLDDVGFAAIGSFGSRIDTPHLDRLARDGLRFSAFNVAPVGAATLAALLTGRNPHAVGMADHPEPANGYSSHSGSIPPNVPLLPAMLKAHGYAAFAVGQWHLTPTWAGSAAIGYFDQWPTGRGFDHFYGWLAGSTHQWYPELYRDTTPMDPPHTPDEGYHVSADLVDHAIHYLDDLRSADAKRPYFLYLAFGAAGAPQQAPKAYRETYRGRFAQGWDAERSMLFERQKILGVVPPETRLTPRGPEMPEWDKLGPDRQTLFQAYMENYAGFLTHTDAQVGRLIEHIRAAGRMDNTLIMVLSDHGTSFAGGPDGVLNRVARLNGLGTELGEAMARRDEIGEPSTAPEIPRGWAVVCNTPFRGGAGFVDNGGVRVPFILHWPRQVSNPGSVHRQWLFVTDVVPTILESLEVRAPTVYRGVPQAPLHGRSFRKILGDAEAPVTHDTQYWEYRGNRGIYHRGWKAVAAPAASEGKGFRPGNFDRNTWQLYQLDKDFAEAEDLAGKSPDKLAEMISRFWSEAGRYEVFPPDEHMPAPPRGARQVVAAEARTRQFTFFQPMSPLAEDLAPDIFGKDYTVTVFLERHEPRLQGVLVAQGGITGGWSLYIRDDKLKFAYNYLGSALYFAESKEELPEGRVKLRYRFSKARNHSGKGELFVEERKVGEVSIDRLVPTTFGTEPFDVGRDSQSPVTGEYRPPFAYGGRIEKVELSIDE